MNPSLGAARLRYLTAIGAAGAALPLAGLAAAGCKDPPPPAVAEAGTTTTGTATQAAVTPTATPTARPEMRMPSCPSGTFCTSEPVKLDSKDAAPAPYAKCALTAAKDAPDSGPELGLARRVSFSAEATATARAKTADACCYTWVMPCPGGRVFRDATGTPSVAQIVARSDWSASIGALALADLAPEARAARAEHWLGEAAFEHASIASFAQLTLDLLSVAAPPELLRSAQHATLDEIEHARITFALAEAYGAGTSGPSTLVAAPEACRTLAALARRTFVDACIGESVAAAALAEDARDARDCSDPVLSELLATMGADEERHAELAWRIVTWAVRTGGPEVARALSDAQAEAVDELIALASDVATLTASPRHRLRATVLREVVLPCSVALLAEAQGNVVTADRSSGLLHRS